MDSRTWGAEIHGKNAGSLVEVVRPLTPKAKKAMYGAAMHGIIARGTWNGCAFNQAGLKEGVQTISSVGAAAQLFDLTPHVVERFINAWDSTPGTDEEATEKLREALVEVGLFSDPNEGKGRRVLRQTIYKSIETQLREEFETLVSGLDLNTDESELVADIKEASLVLSGTC